MTHILETANIFMTGGAGTLGTAIAARRKLEGWSGKLTVYSTDNHKHDHMRRKFSDVNFVQGDIRNPETLYNAMVGHDVCLHLAAVKVIPDAEWHSLDTIDVNINGSVNVCVQAMQAGIKHVLGISTDKACHPANLYGATKYAMEKVFAEFSRVPGGAEFHLARYGNVIDSNSSVLQAWRKASQAGEKIQITDPAMTRFWMSPGQAVDAVIQSITGLNGWIYIPKMKALSIGKFADYILGEKYPYVRIPLRPGEKFHETLLTIDECRKAAGHPNYFALPPTTEHHHPYWVIEQPYTSDTAPELTKEELLEMLE